MALNFDLTKVKGWREQNEQVTNAVIWNMLSIGMKNLTVENIDEAVRRTELVDDVIGHRVSTLEGKSLLSRETLTKYIGLSTNVANETFKQFFKRMSA